MAWHRKLVAKKFDGSKKRKYPGRPKIDKASEELIVDIAKANRTWDYDRIVGAVKELGHKVSDQTVELKQLGRSRLVCRVPSLMASVLADVARRVAGHGIDPRR